MILHICGNLCAGKTTAAEHVQSILGWPVVPVGRLRNVVRNEHRLWADVVPRLWRAWDQVGAPSGIWLSTGFNHHEVMALERYTPQALRRVWLTAPPTLLHRRLADRLASPTYAAPRGYWPYIEDSEMLIDELANYDRRIRPLPWPVDRIINTAETSISDMVVQIVAVAREGLFPRD